MGHQTFTYLHLQLLQTAINTTTPTTIPPSLNPRLLLLHPPSPHHYQIPCLTPLPPAFIATAAATTLTPTTTSRCPCLTPPPPASIVAQVEDFTGLPCNLLSQYDLRQALTICGVRPDVMDKGEEPPSLQVCGWGSRPEGLGWISRLFHLRQWLFIYG